MCEKKSGNFLFFFAQKFLPKNSPSCGDFLVENIFSIFVEKIWVPPPVGDIEFENFWEKFKILEKILQVMKKFIFIEKNIEI